MLTGAGARIHAMAKHHVGAVAVLVAALAAGIPGHAQQPAAQPAAQPQAREAEHDKLTDEERVAFAMRCRCCSGWQRWARRRQGEM